MLVVLAGGLRVARLDEPGRIYFDELYYVGDAQQYLEHGVEEVRPAHPPVGKWLIAAGIVVAGDDPFGWRIAGAAAGTLTVLATYLIGLRLFRRRVPAAIAALLVALDGCWRRSSACSCRRPSTCSVRDSMAFGRHDG